MEAAGVEPASENAVSQEPTYLVRFPRRSPGTLALCAQNRQETQWASLKISSAPPDVGLRTSSLCDAVSRPVSKAGDSGYLIN